MAVQKEDVGAWLWCAKDDFVIDAVRKVRKASGLMSAALLVAKPDSPEDTTGALATFLLRLTDDPRQRRLVACLRPLKDRPGAHRGHHHEVCT